MGKGDAQQGGASYSHVGHSYTVGSQETRMGSLEGFPHLRALKEATEEREVRGLNSLASSHAPFPLGQDSPHRWFPLRRKCSGSQIDLEQKRSRTPGSGPDATNLLLPVSVPSPVLGVMLAVLPGGQAGGACQPALGQAQ